MDRLNYWFDFYKKRPMTTWKLKRIRKNFDKTKEVFFTLPFFNKNGFYMKKGLGLSNFNEITFSLIVKAFCNLIDIKNNNKILVIENSNKSLDKYSTIAQEIFGAKNMEISVLDQPSQIQNIVSYAFQKINFDYGIFIQYDIIEKTYSVSFLDSKGYNIDLGFYGQILNEINNINFDQIKYHKKAPRIIKTKNLIDNFKDDSIAHFERKNDQRKLKVFIAKNNFSFENFTKRILGSMDIRYFSNTSKKNANFKIWKIFRKLKKIKFDLAFLTNSLGSDLDVVLNFNGKTRKLEKHQLLRIFLELYLMNKKLKQELTQMSFILIPSFLEKIFEPITQKYQVNLVQSDQVDHQNLKMKNFLFAINDDLEFNFNYKKIFFFNKFEFIVIFTELINYYKTQNGNVSNVVNFVKNIYPPLYFDKANLKVEQKTLNDFYQLIETKSEKNTLFQNLILIKSQNCVLIKENKIKSMIKLVYDEFEGKLQMEIFSWNDEENFVLAENLFSSILKFFKSYKG
ncbi:MAG5620 family putative phospho-sugar mutase [Mycoplasmopsis pulmonis]|uniref:MAG5620 family putative phospho-sugar mutase n=1 Tax=Mycoplasmopsis pulmonis TaxID=2107 RepID=UPI00100504C4|nr:hypothetical protein [Mycoplasmopsis pulmonis]VEU68475.1 Uncharacterised protein [Mycoplasmopsis pulmonis]